jgi:predicted Zn-dependent protease
MYFKLGATGVLALLVLILQTGCAAQLAQHPCSADACYGQGRWQAAIDRTAATNFPGETFSGKVYADRLHNAWTTFDDDVNITADLLYELSRAGEPYVLSVAAHEIAHLRSDHFLQKATHSYILYFKSLVGLHKIKSGARHGPHESDPSIAALSREQEFEADRLAVQYLTKAGYNKDAYLDFLKWMQGHLDDALPTDSASHPAFAERITRIEALPLPEQEPLKH